MADVELLPLPEWTKRDDLGGLVPSEVRSEMHAYARANMEPLRAEVRRLTFELDAATIYGNDRDAHYQQAEARAERLAEALRDARRALAFAAQHLPECNEPYERANAALPQEYRND